MGAIPYHPAATQLDTIAADVITLYGPIAEAKEVKLLHEIPAGMVAWADERALHTVLRNLVGNALKFTHAGGEVCLRAVETSSNIQFEVNDTGVGISAEKLPQLFSVAGTSSQGTTGEKGSGLGLVLCKELIERNQGTIQAISELGRGSCFVFSLPKLSLAQG
jgi:signal transduction histidine kinase